MSWGLVSTQFLKHPLPQRTILNCYLYPCYLADADCVVGWMTGPTCTSTHSTLISAPSSAPGHSAQAGCGGQGKQGHQMLQATQICRWASSLQPGHCTFRHLPPSTCCPTAMLALHCRAHWPHGWSMALEVSGARGAKEAFFMQRHSGSHEIYAFARLSSYESYVQSS